VFFGHSEYPVTVAGMKSLILMPSLAKKSFSFTYCPFSAAPPIHWLSPIMRSHSLPLELSSFSMRSAKFGQGTNSNFIWIPVFAVKSFDSSTSALAGSHAAQHSVIVLVCACAADAKASIAHTAIALAAAMSLFMTDTSCDGDPNRRLPRR
jgi:hypothetical protein